MLSRRPVRTSIATLLSATLLTIGLGAVMPSAAVADSPGVSHSPQHVWVDPTVRNVDGDYDFSFIVNMPEVTELAVMHATAPQFTTGPVSCIAPEPIDGDESSCVGEGDAIPGEYTISLELRVVSGVLHTWSVPLTVCPLTGCSDLFSLTISPDPMVIWANPTITEQTYGQYDFNIDWNPLEVRIDELRDAQGNIAPGIYDPRSEIPADGSQFNYHGTFTVPGYYYGTITMIDEFGGEHDAPYTVRVCTPETCADLLKLPDTGVAAVAITAGAAFAVLAVGAGAFMLVVRRRTS